MKVHGGGVLNGLCRLVYLLVRAGPVQDSHLEQAKEDQIVDVTPIDLSKPLGPSDHVCPEPIIKKEVQVYIPPPPVMNNSLIIQFACLHNPIKGILGNLSISVSVQSKQMKREITS